MVVFVTGSYAAVETSDSEALRNRAKQEAQQHEDEQKQPQVNLQGEPSSAAPLPILSDEATCFVIHDFILQVPEQLPLAVQRLVASGLPLDRFYFVQEMLTQYKGQCIGRESINSIVKGVTEKILQYGYSTTRIAIPAQNLTSGRLILTLIPGVIHELRFADKDTAGTWENAFPSAAGTLLNLRDLEQGLEQMKRVLSQEVDLQIVPAQGLGESDIIISVKRGKPWRATLNVDDTGAKGTGKRQAGLQFGLDNLFGLNDVFSIGTNTDVERNSSLGTQGNNFSYSIPYGYWTATLSGSDSSYHQRVMGAVQSFMSSGKSQNFETKINYLFHRDQFSKSSLQFRTGKRWSHAFIDDTEIMVQKRNTTLAEIALIHKHNMGATQLDTTFAYRWGAPWFGAQRDAVNLPTNLPSYRYTLETLDSTLSVPLNIHQHSCNYTLNLRAQNANMPLYGSEWFSIGNRWTVRGFDGEAALGAETGFFVRNELGIPITNSRQTAYLGMDFGKVYGANTSNLVGNKLAGIVLGWRGSAMGALSYDAFLARALYKPQGLRTEQPAMGFSLNYQ
ncbi:MAG: ShlB/FhaC/HecB family hemolysin secretion/activation protein, partial [Gallionella sp.]